MIYIVYTPDGSGCFLASAPFTDLDAAKTATPEGGHVEQISEDVSTTVFQN